MIDKLTELGPLFSQLPSAFKEIATKLECFYKDILDYYAPICEALAKNTFMVEAKEKVLNDLTSLKKMKLEVTHFIVKTKTGLDEVKKKSKKLEEEMKLLVKEEVS